MDHSHSHSHGHCHNEDDHLAPPDTNPAQTLYPYIDLANVRVLNAQNSDHAAQIIRPYEERLAPEPVLTSDVDEELIIVIPFIGLVKLHSLLIRTLGDDSAPEKLLLFKDKPQIDFDMAHSTPALQTLENPAGIGAGVTTSEGSDGIVQFALNRPKFSNTQTLTIFIPSNFGSPETKIAYIGLRGEFTSIKKGPVVAKYEAAANPADHKTKAKAFETNNNQIG